MLACIRRRDAGRRASSSGFAAFQVRRTGAFSYRPSSDNPENCRTFWPLLNRNMSGGVHEGLVRAVTDVWKRCLQILANEIQRGIDEGVFRSCDAWEMANILWIVGNGLLETDLDPARRSLRARDLEEVFQDALELMIRGLKA